jgi:hypothetical protein
MHKRFGEDAQIKAGKTGQFDVILDGKLIFSKASTGRFPADGEVEDLFATLKPGSKKAVPDASATEPSKKQVRSERSGVLGRLTDKFRN